MQYTYEDMVEIFDESGFKPNILKEEYINANQLIEYECLKCGHQSRTSLTFCLSGRKCRKCVRKELADQQRHDYEYVKSVFEERGCELLSKEYINKDTLLDYICHCSKEARSTFGNFKKIRHCSNCVVEILGDNTRLNFEYVKAIFENEGCELLEDIYLNVNVKMRYKCSCGNIDHKDFHHFVRGQRCDECAIKARKEKLKHDYEYVESLFKERNYKLLSEEYENANTHLEYECSCGNIASVTLNNLSKISGCVECASKSKGEDKIAKHLKNIDMNYKRQFKFDNCRYKNPLPFDFGLINNKTELICLVEYDGEHHFKPVRFNGISQEEAEENFKLIQIKDKIKNEYCQNNNIILLRIPYWEFNNIENILNNLLQEEEGLNTSSFLVNKKEVI